MKKPNCTCDWCKKDFRKCPSQLRPHNFCCRECKAHWQQGRKKTTETKQKISIANKKHDAIVRTTCHYCGKSLVRRKSYPESIHSYCNHTCRGLARIGTAQAEETKRKISNGVGSKSDHHSWRGGFDGTYHLVKCPSEFIQMARKSDNRVLRHRLVVAQYLKRPLTPLEVVHHMDENTSNNSIENLALFKCEADHHRFHLTGKPEPIWSSKCEK